LNTCPTPRESYFERIDAHRFKPTQHASGAWNPGEMHFGPLSGLIAHAVDEHRSDRAGDGLTLGRITFDILGFMALDECEIHTETIRPGRTIELVQAVATIAGRPVVTARAWFLAATDTASVAGGAPEPLPAPDTLESWPLDSVWAGGYVGSVDLRPTTAPRPGRTTAWVATDLQLIAGETSSAQAEFISKVDVANGIAVREPTSAWTFPNIDLTIHLHRRPEGRWTGLDTTVVFGPTGLGTTCTVLHDVHGPVGQAEQLLTVRPRPEAR
jgi:hypothetical protein